MADWCPIHKTYSAKRAPGSTCGNCWALWFLRCPEERDGGLLRERPPRRKLISASLGETGRASGAPG